MTRLRVLVLPKQGVVDPQGATVERSLASLGHGDVSGVRVGKVVELTIDEADPARAIERADELCVELLANPVIETWQVEVLDGGAAGAGSAAAPASLAGGRA